MMNVYEFRTAVAAAGPMLWWLSAHLPDARENRNGFVLGHRSRNLTGAVGGIVRAPRKANRAAVLTTPRVPVATGQIVFEGRSEDE